MTKLTEYIEKAEGTPLIWGESDCTAWAASWVSEASGVLLDIPEWNSRRDAKRLIVEAGSLLELWSGVLSRSSFYRTWQPVNGDVGIINTGIYGPVGCIFCCGLPIEEYRATAVAVRSEKSASLMGLRPENMIAAWSIGYEET